MRFSKKEGFGPPLSHFRSGAKIKTFEVVEEGALGHRQKSRFSNLALDFFLSEDKIAKAPRTVGYDTHLSFFALDHEKVWDSYGIFSPNFYTQPRALGGGGCFFDVKKMAF